ncbi:MAG: hypothetical protein KF752_11645 [Pirellulaceae bacterium]|nr:hypothetical protein [Pirellulaceae bacterium]
MKIQVLEDEATHEKTLRWEAIDCGPCIRLVQKTEDGDIIISTSPVGEITCPLLEPGDYEFQICNLPRCFDCQDGDWITIDSVTIENPCQEDPPPPPPNEPGCCDVLEARAQNNEIVLSVSIPNFAPAPLNVGGTIIRANDMCGEIEFLDYYVNHAPNVLPWTGVPTLSAENIQEMYTALWNWAPSISSSSGQSASQEYRYGQLTAHSKSKYEQKVFGNYAYLNSFGHQSDWAIYTRTSMVSVISFVVITRSCSHYRQRLQYPPYSLESLPEFTDNDWWYRHWFFNLSMLYEPTEGCNNTDWKIKSYPNYNQIDYQKNILKGINDAYITNKRYRPVGIYDLIEPGYPYNYTQVTVSSESPGQEIAFPNFPKTVKIRYPEI